MMNGSPKTAAHPFARLSVAQNKSQVSAILRPCVLAAMVQIQSEGKLWTTNVKEWQSKPEDVMAILREWCVSNNRPVGKSTMFVNGLSAGELFQEVRALTASMRDELKYRHHPEYAGKSGLRRGIQDLKTMRRNITRSEDWKPIQDFARLAGIENRRALEHTKSSLNPKTNYAEVLDEYHRELVLTLRQSREAKVPYTVGDPNAQTRQGHVRKPNQSKRRSSEPVLNESIAIYERQKHPTQNLDDAKNGFRFPTSSQSKSGEGFGRFSASNWAARAMRSSR